MNGFRTGILSAMLVGAALCSGEAAFAQAQPGQQPTAPAPAAKEKAPAATPPTLDSAPPVNAEEDAALKAFQDAPMSDLPKKEQMGEDFAQKYPQSRYRADVYSWLVQAYLRTGQVDKMESAGEKELALNPNDPQMLAAIGSALPRAMTASMSAVDKERRLAKAEEYCKKALDLLATFPKPAGMNDETFVGAKNSAMAMANSGLGLVAFRREKYADAIPYLEQSVKLQQPPDTVDLFVLGVCNQKTSHYDDASALFARCAAVPGGLQGTCKSAAEEAKKLAATQLSVPK